MYVRDVKQGTTLPDGQPIIDKETVSTALVNANNILGPVSHKYSENIYF
jgi:LDH2 family malate/lactate/ureidoglycolate dehydrogenase